MHSSPSSPRPVSDPELREQRTQIGRGLQRLNTAAIAILLVVLVLALAAILAMQRSDRLRARAELAEADARAKLYETHLAQARAERLTGSMGRRRRSLEAIKAAVELRRALPDSDPTVLRNEAIASLALADVELTNSLRKFVSAPTALHFAPSLQLYAMGHPNGEVTLDRFSDGQNLRRLRSPGETGAVGHVKFSPDAKRIAVAYKSGALFLFSLETEDPPLLVRPAAIRDSRAPLQFSADGQWLGVLASEGRAQIFNLENPTEPIGEFAQVNALAFHPKTNLVALSFRSGLRFVDFAGREVMPAITNAPSADEIAFRPDGKQLAGASAFYGMALWNLRTREPTRLLAPSGGFHNLLYDSRGEIITAALGDGVSRIWSAHTGELLHTLEGGRMVQFAANGEGFAFEKPREGVTLGHILRSPAVGSLHWQADEDYFRRFWCVDFSGDGRWVAGVDNGYLVVWNLPSREVFANFRATPRQLSVSWLPGERAWLTTSSRRVSVYPTQRNSPLHPGQPRHIELTGVPFGLGQATLAPDGRTFGVVTNSGGALLLDLKDSGKRTPLLYDGPGSLGHLAFSPDGRWIASSATEGFAILVWETATGKLVRQIPGRHGRVAYSPDGRHLVVGNAHEYNFWDTTTWQADPERSVPRDNLEDTTGALAFSPEGRMLALVRTRQLVQVVDPDTSRELASLQAPDPQTISWLRFNAQGTRLAAAGFDGVVHVWDIAWLQKQLASWGLGWHETPDARNLPASGQRQSTWLLLPIFAVVLVLLFVVFAFRRQRQLFDAYVEVDRLALERAGELETAKAEIVHSQKMKALGTLAAGIAHDFNNLLSVIRMSNTLIARANLQDAEVTESVTEIERAVQQGKHVVRSMLGYSRQETAIQGPISVAEVIEDTVALLSKQFLSGIQLTLELQPETARVNVSPSKIEQVLLNLIVNAVEAMQGAGRLRLELRGLKNLPDALILPPRSAARYLGINVADSGPGIDPKILGRIFEPFFTTKNRSTSPGTGLGLSTVYAIAESEGWGIRVNTELGRGTVFEIVLPVDSKVPAAG